MKAITVRAARQKRGWTQEQLAALAGVDQTTISDLETGRNANPSFDIVMRVANALQVDVRAIRFGQEAVAS